MTTNRDELVYAVETYGNGLLSDETIERTVDILMECNPVPCDIDLIDIDSIIQAVENHGAEHLYDVYDLEYDPDAVDWYIPMKGMPDVYLGIGDVDGDTILNYAVRYMSGRDWRIMYRVSLSDTLLGPTYHDKRGTAVEYAFTLERAMHCRTFVDQVARCYWDDCGVVRDEYVTRRII